MRRVLCFGGMVSCKAVLFCGWVVILVGVVSVLLSVSDSWGWCNTGFCVRVWVDGLAWCSSGL